jgi:hypothetical protein
MTTMTQFMFGREAMSFVSDLPNGAVLFDVGQPNRVADFGPGIPPGEGVPRLLLSNG